MFEIVVAGLFEIDTSFDPIGKSNVAGCTSYGMR